ncbi:RimJ/RimL family protein N-acetyltransferase [Diaminobutyricimonas aerilata]|uniref:RimJ/RimL family protein N-acetyltransferase n=1 Tax=Diaminobutyricimonas aerilata TaxID=1162967 RepID=A0A2M9CJJ8_9MICO|nr:GNAT family N-acetyltransferase [Diaminobutyricimonas aerilata]PJJ72070.1 RimJ/RimL family protein N-acetyltransferase [Diaminobutyricimonas aerilata]
MVEIYRPVEPDWERVRDLRLRALRDTPVAFLESVDDALALPEEIWRERARRNEQPDTVVLVARDAEAGWVGTMTAVVSEAGPWYLDQRRERPRERRAYLVGVWIDPGFRGREAGVTDQLLAAIAAWVRDDRGLARLHLHVSDENPRARRYYERRGFTATGVLDRIEGRDDTQVELVAAVADLIPA